MIAFNQGSILLIAPHIDPKMRNRL